MSETEPQYRITAAYDDGAMVLQRAEQTFVLGKNDFSPAPHACDPVPLDGPFNRHAFETTRHMVSIRDLVDRLLGDGIRVQLNSPLPFEVIRLISQYLHLRRNHAHVSQPVPIHRDGESPIDVDHQRRVTRELALDSRVRRLRKVTRDLDTELIGVIRELREKLDALAA